MWGRRHGWESVRPLELPGSDSIHVLAGRDLGSSQNS